MPVISCGGMRLQDTWAPHEAFGTRDVSFETEKNMTEIVKEALRRGINHFETARGYGCSEIQYGSVLGNLLASSHLKRSELILQTKVVPCESAKKFEETLEKSLKALSIRNGPLKFVDLLSIHGINTRRQLEWTLKFCLPVLKRYREKGLIRFIGFSTHAMTHLIVETIRTNEFDYVNLHYHFIGSYTASGSSNDGLDNREAVCEARKRNMGVFIISAQDKGGMLYKPSRKMARLTMPLKPMEFNTLFLLLQRSERDDDSLIHTLVVGASRPSDFEAHVRAVQGLNNADVRRNVAHAENALRRAWQSAVDSTWKAGKRWFKGVPHCYANDFGIHVSMIIWLLLLTKAYGLLEYARARYEWMENNTAKWNSEENPEQNMRRLFNWNPGCAWTYGKTKSVPDLSPWLRDATLPVEKIIDLLCEAHDMFRVGASKEKLEAAKKEYEASPAFDMQPDVPIPDRGNAKRPRDVVGTWTGEFATASTTSPVTLVIRTDGTWSSDIAKDGAVLSGKWHCKCGLKGTREYFVMLRPAARDRDIELTKSRDSPNFVSCRLGGGGGAVTELTRQDGRT